MRNEYYVPHHRFMELKYFCLQYDYWKERIEEIDGFPTANFSGEKNLKNISNPVLHTVERREEYQHNIDLIDEAVKLADESIYGYLIAAITKGVSYYGLRCYQGMPSCKEKYYIAYRKFFFILDKTRK